MLSLDDKTNDSVNNNYSNHNFRLDGYFCDYAVFQRNQIIPVSGYAKAQTVVELKFGDITASTLASFDGRFTINIPPMDVVKKQPLYVYNEGIQICCENVSVGEVYLISGQSNMEFSLKSCIPGEEEITDHDLECIRYFKVPPTSFYGRQTSLQGKWQKISRDDAKNISGCGFFFASYLAKNINMPIGLINASLGGMNIESFISKETLLTNLYYQKELLEYEKNVSLQGTHNDGNLPNGDAKIQDGLAKLFPQVPDTSHEENLWTKEDFCDKDWDSMYLPDSWTEGGHNHAGIFCYRKTIDIPEEFIGKDLEIHLGAIDKSDKVYFNGTLIGQTGSPDVWKYWNVLRVYTIPANLVSKKSNTITIFAGSLASICMDGGLLGPTEEMYIKLLNNDNTTTISLASLWRYKEIYDAGTIGMTFMRSLGPGVPSSFHMLYDNMIYPLSGIPMRGVLWYQGEANGICMAKEYEKLLFAMESDWRKILNNPKLEFYIIQLPDYHNPHYFAPYNQWNLIREAQNNVALKDTYTDCVVTLGWGDVVNLHPTNKKDVGYAAAKFALARLNGNPIKVPTLKSLSCEKQALILTFEEDNLPAVGTTIEGFAIAGNDEKAYVAKAEVINKNLIKVYSQEVQNPTSVWYAWACNPICCNFTSADGIKVSPFRATLNGTPQMAIAKNLIHQ